MVVWYVTLTYFVVTRSLSQYRILLKPTFLKVAECKSHEAIGQGHGHWSGYRPEFSMIEKSYKIINDRKKITKAVALILKALVASSDCPR